MHVAYVGLHSRSHQAKEVNALFAKKTNNGSKQLKVKESFN